MDLKKIVSLSYLKIAFITIYLLLLFFSNSHPSDAPESIGFPFIYKIEGCYGWTGECLNEFYPNFLLLDILIPVAIYLGFGLVESALYSKSHK